MDWTVVSVVTDWTAAEAVAEVLKPFAYQQSVVFEQQGDDRQDEPLALLPTVQVKATIRSAADTPDFRRRLSSALDRLRVYYQLPDPVYTPLAERDWAEAWKEHFQPIPISPNLLILPSWLAADYRPASDQASPAVLLIDPGMAFGTGQHASTLMCLQLLDRLLSPGARVLDVGTGSGILAIAAALLGAGRVLALDNDEVAVAAARQNCALNGVQAQVEVRFGTLPAAAGGDWDLVLVNILAPVIVTMLAEEALLAHLAGGGRLLLSGIVERDRRSVASAVAAGGGRVLETARDGDWVTLVAAA